MGIQRHKNAIYAVSLILIFAVSIVMAFAPTASAQVGITQPRQTYAYISVAPLTVGVGQQLTVNLWVLPLPQDYAESPWYGSPDNGSYTGISVTFTKPDGTTDTFTPTDGTGTFPAGELDALGSMFFYYAPDEAGNWSVTFSMPAQNFTDATGKVQWTACTSQPFHFTVQTAAVNAGLLNGYPYQPLPNSNVYWSYPINSNNREWAAIAGDWLDPLAFESNLVLNTGGYWQPYGTGPNTGHILWDIPYSMGGIVGGELGDDSYQTQQPALVGDLPVIMDGKVYINIPFSEVTSSVPVQSGSFECIDLTTGKILYTAPGTIQSGIDTPGNAYAQSSSTYSVTLSGSYGSSPSPYLFYYLGGTWKYYDPNTGQLEMSIANSTAESFELIDGSPLAYGEAIGARGFSLFEWNISKVVGDNWPTGLVWSTPIQYPGYGFAMSYDQSTIVLGGGRGSSILEGFSTTNGHSIWNDTLSYASEAGFTQLYDENAVLLVDLTTSTFYCYSDLTGALLWSSPNVGTYPWNTKYSGYEVVNDQNNVYVGLPSGQIVALSLANGHVAWTSQIFNSTENVENANGYWIAALVEEGGLIYGYAGGTLSYQLNPIPRFDIMTCTNASTGQTVFTLPGGVYPTAAADGYIVGTGDYDGNLYCIGKGQSSTSVSAPTTAQPLGTSILLQGNVLDESPAQAGTPAVSDSSMSEQMDYLHMQNATLLNSPPTPQGVQVTLTALDPNNNTENIGTITTNGQGTYGINWTPPVPGQYVITATFAGTNSYYRSSAETRLLVSPAAAPTTTTTTVVSSGVSATTLYEAIVAVIVVVIVAVAVAVLLLRKRA